MFNVVVGTEMPMKRRYVWMTVAVGLCVLDLLRCGAGCMAAEATQAMGGWEKGGAYDKLYKAAEMDRIKGEITDIREAPPLPGMAPGVIVMVREEKSQPITVHLCPVAYMNGAATTLKKGDKVKIRGAWAEVGGKDVFMAAKVKKGDFFDLKVRLTKDGTPFWSMSPEERAANQKESD
jgi:hypothetical protein